VEHLHYGPSPHCLLPSQPRCATAAGLEKSQHWCMTTARNSLGYERRRRRGGREPALRRRMGWRRSDAVPRRAPASDLDRRGFLFRLRERTGSECSQMVYSHEHEGHDSSFNGPIVVGLDGPSLVRISFFFFFWKMSGRARWKRNSVTPSVHDCTTFMLKYILFGWNKCR
jgi:hypothetical protein